jgi:hypothetical protein
MQWCGEDEEVWDMVEWSGVQRRSTSKKSTSADSGGPAEGEREDTRSDRLALFVVVVCSIAQLFLT